MGKLTPKLMDHQQQRALRVGMVGGGPGGFIGQVHRHAMCLDGNYKLVAGVFSRDPTTSAALGATLGICSSRLYTSFEQMAESEAALPAEERIELCVVVTPTPTHAEAALAFISRGFPVVCDKPLCSTIVEADRGISAIGEHQTAFMLIHNYSGYPMVKQAREMVRDGRIGDLNKVVVEYEQGWLCEETQLSSTGAISSLADVGTHALQLAQYVTGAVVTSVMADVSTMVGGARTPDDANILLRLSGGCRGVMIASQASAGQANGLRLRVYGSKGGLTWDQESPEKLQFLPSSEPAQTLVRNGPGLCESARLACRTPIGHPEGFIEAFANLYTAFHRRLTSDGEEGFDHPTADDGRAGLVFIEACMQSNEEGAWVDIDKVKTMPASVQAE